MTFWGFFFKCFPQQVIPQLNVPWQLRLLQSWFHRNLCFSNLFRLGTNIQSTVLGLPWWSSGLDSMLPLQGAWVQSLVRELRSFRPCRISPPPQKKKVCASGLQSDYVACRFTLAGYVCFLSVSAKSSFMECGMVRAKIFLKKLHWLTRNCSYVTVMAINIDFPHPTRTHKCGLGCTLVYCC